MGFWGIILAVTGFFIPVFMVSMYFVGIRCSLKTWSLIGLPFIAIGISGILFIQADSYRSTPKQVFIYSAAGWIILACALLPLVYALIKSVIEYRQCYSNLNHTSAAHTTPPVTGVLPLCTRLRRVRRNNPPWRSL